MAPVAQRIACCAVVVGLTACGTHHDRRTRSDEAKRPLYTVAEVRRAFAAARVSLIPMGQPFSTPDHSTLASANWDVAVTVYRSGSKSHFFVVLGDDASISRANVVVTYQKGRARRQLVKRALALLPKRPKR